MANHPYDREVIQNLERPLSSDLNLGQTYWAQALVETLYREYASRSSLSSDASSFQPPAGVAAFIGGGFKARGVSGALQVSLDAGMGFFNDNTTTTSIGSVSGVNDNELIKPLVLTAAEIINIPAADPSNPRVDIIEIQSGRQLTDATSRDVFNPSAAAFQPSTVNKTLSYYLGGRSTVNGAGPINYKTGAPAASPSGPAVDAGYSVIAQVYVPAAASSLGATSFADMRRMLFPAGVLRVSGIVQCVGSGPATAGPIALQSVVAPPGVEVTATSDTRFGWPGIRVYVKAGDAGQLRTDIFAGFVGVTPQSPASVGSNYNSGLFKTDIPGAAERPVLANATPAIAANAYQTMWSFDVGQAGITSTSYLAFDAAIMMS